MYSILFRADLISSFLYTQICKNQAVQGYIRKDLMKNVKHAKRCTKQRRQFYLGDAPHHLDPFYRNLIDSQASRTTDQTSWKGTTLCIS